MSLRRFLSRLIPRRPCRHRWEGSCWNRYCHDVEQTCDRCGARRHAPTFEQYARDEWVTGPHPWAAAERAKQKGTTP